MVRALHVLGPHWLLAQPPHPGASPLLLCEGTASAMRQGSLSPAAGCFSSGLQTKHRGAGCGSSPSLVLDANVSHVDHLSAALGKSLFFLFISFIVLFKDVLKVCSVHYLVSLQYAFEGVLRLQRRSDGLWVGLPAEPHGTTRGEQAPFEAPCVCQRQLACPPTVTAVEAAAGRAGGWETWWRCPGALPTPSGPRFSAFLCSPC